MHLTIDEASNILIAKMVKEFGDAEGRIDALKAAVAIYNNPLLLEANNGFRYQLKAVKFAIKYPWASLHHYKIWEWAGLKLVKSFEIKG